MERVVGLIAAIMLAATGFAIARVVAPYLPGWMSVPAAAIAFGQQVVGSGDLVSDTRSVGTFRSISSKGSVDVRVTVGPAASVVVEAQKNILSLIDTKVEDGTLVVSSHGSFTTTRNPLIKITVPELRGVSVSGSSDVKIAGMRGSSLDLNVYGSGDVSADGSVDRLTYTGSGSGDARLKSLNVRDAVIKIRGSGEADVHVSGTLDVDVSGSGEVRYSGGGRIVRQNIRGSGSVTPD
jgi:Putative auto-transporter adhesin, head GIN domain